MSDNEENEKEEKKCKRCGSILLSCDGRKAGYCRFCANKYEDIRKVWEDMGLAKFCSKCGLTLHEKGSIEAGKCEVCRFKDSIGGAK